MSRPPRQHPLSRAPLVDRLNDWLETMWRRGISTRPTLDPRELWQKGAHGHEPGDEFTARQDEDAADFRLRLETIAAALVSEAQLNPLGLTMAHGQLVRAVRHRFELGRLWRQRPELVATPLAAPIVVVGHMRSGTTRMHRLLAADPAHAATRFCDSWSPVPRRPDTRPLWSALALGFAHRLDPWLETLHPFGATRPDEELGWLAAALDHCAFEAQWRIPSYVAFSEARDAAPVYREFARLLATDAAWHANAEQPRVLKVPQFAEDLPVLLQQFPDARLVVTRRDPEEVLASSASLVANQRTIQSDDVDLAQVEAECARKIALREQRIAAALATLDAKVAETGFSELDEGWEAPVERVYRQLGLKLGDAARRSMAREMANSRHGAHEGHARQYREMARA